MEPAFDYIIVGGGSAGCAVAGRLAESGKYRVALLEAGPSGHGLWTRMPIGYGKTFYEPRVNWMYQTAPVPGLGGRTSYWPRGKVLGGSSTINAMVYSRGQAADFEEWAALGNVGWGWSDVLAAYRRMEDHDLGAGPWHGAGGPLHVSTIDQDAHPLTAIFLQAAAEMGLPFSPDLNGETIEGAGHYQITTRKGLRESAATAYLKPRPNLYISTETQATRLLLDGRRVSGVATMEKGRQRDFFAAKEVIVAAGSIGSPHLLQLSGIGPAGLLKRVGIEVALDVPAVGQNLQDHLCYDHVYKSRRPSLNDALGPWMGKLRVGLQYLLFRKGPLALSLNQGGGYYRSRPGLAAPDIQLYFSPLSYERAQTPRVRALMSPDPFPGFSTSVSPCKPKSAGHLAITSPDWRVAPEIHPNYLSDPFDVAQLLDGARYLRRLAATPSFAAVIEAEMKPGGAAQSDADLIADIQARCYSVFHPVGTCRMGPDPANSVVDPQLRLHGLAGLRVADASIFPVITSGNTNAPAIMVGERAAEFVLGAP
ncbi:GMC family oxidoreductase [Dongia rigui]|uniref:GMC family oxidoreductase N-terminal domain-containing protein n=1 Tax=Dongia rigui TaxID=940149 RepID=A0ABU5E0E0_9PROT|nr:GMC family oxidoreductase N-terminal domain-containing protein [Dongia rigui]MDY0873010.1 GMC family oxidoreductase N-terminal domain-containing protein [Dongia rigui]